MPVQDGSSLVLGGGKPWTTLPPMRRRIGSEIRRLRAHAGISQGQLTTAICMSQSMTSAIELGRKGAKREHLAAMDAALSTGGALTRLWDSLHTPSAFPSWFQSIVKLERAATEIREYIAALIPGLIQTTDYARSIIRNANHWDNDETIDELAVTRNRRTEVLTAGQGPLVWFVIDESAITDIVGSPEILWSQLDQMLSLMDKRLITVQVLPRGASRHPVRGAAFRVMSFHDRPAVAYLEHMLGGVLVEQAEEVRKCQAIYGALQAEALNVGESERLVRQRQGDCDEAGTSDLEDLKLLDGFRRQLRRDPRNSPARRPPRYPAPPARPSHRAHPRVARVPCRPPLWRGLIVPETPTAADGSTPGPVDRRWCWLRRSRFGQPAAPSWRSQPMWSVRSPN